MSAAELGEADLTPVLGAIVAGIFGALAVFTATSSLIGSIGAYLVIAIVGYSVLVVAKG